MFENKELIFNDIEKYCKDIHKFENIKVNVLEPGTELYNISLSKFNKNFLKKESMCSHVSETMTPKIVKARNLDYITTDKSVYFYFCPNCDTYIMKYEINVSSVKNILYTNSLGRNLHINDLEKKKTSCLDKIKFLMMSDCECKSSINNCISDKCIRCFSL